MSGRITADQLNAFVTPSVEILEKLACIHAQVGTLRRQRWSIPLDTLVILIGVEGDLNGEVVFQFDDLVLKQILIALLGEPPPPLTDPICWDALGELANMIVGNATGRLEVLGLHTTMTLPQILPGEEVHRRVAEKEVIVIPLESLFGEMGISIFLEKA